MIEGSPRGARSDAEPSAGAPGVGTDRVAIFARLADHGLDHAYRLAALLLGSEIEAQDAVQDATLVAWERFGELRDPGRFEPWFQRILVNRCRDRVRHRGRVRLLPMDAGPERPAPDALGGLAERFALRDALVALPAEQREAVVLRYFADLTVDQIADRTGEREGTVKSRLHYGLRALRAAYDAAARMPGETSR